MYPPLATRVEETEEKEIAESYHKREMLVKGTPLAPSPEQ
jgi:hypothetical protein